MTGIVKHCNPERGFGFIAPLIGKPDATPNVFCHVSQCIGGVLPPVGAEVRFDLVRGEEGPQAYRVEVRHLRTRALLRTVESPDPPPAA